MSKDTLYLLYGDEKFLLDQAVKQTMERLSAGTNLSPEVIEGSQEELPHLTDALQTTSMFGGGRLVVVQDKELLGAKRRKDGGGEEEAEKEGESEKGADEGGERAVQQLINALQNIAPGTRVIFTAPRIDQRKKLTKWICQHAAVQEFKALNYWESDRVSPFIMEKVAEQGKRITKKAADVLAEIAGTNLGIIFSEVEKLAVYIGERPEITLTDVMTMASSGQKHVFALFDALERRAAPEALGLTAEMLRDKEPPLRIVSAIATQYRTLLTVKLLLKRRMGLAQISRQLKKSPFIIEKAVKYAQLSTVDELEQYMEDLYRTSKQLKNSLGVPQVLMELLVAQLCRRREN